MTVLLVGRGLLGSAVAGALAAAGREVRTVDVPWGDREAATEALGAAARDAAAADPDWQLAWCAGAGVPSSPSALLRAETATLRAFVEGLEQVPHTFFLASSVGGAYGGSPDAPPYTESSRTGFGSPYGAAKLGAEAIARGAAQAGSRLVLGRISNLYGPGQDLAKAQGLVSTLCRAQVTRQPVSVRVSLDTLRDYLYVGDAGAMVVGCLDRAAAGPPGSVTTKILASGRATSVGMLLGEAQRVLRRRPRLAFGADLGPASDLRVRSTVWTELDALAATPLAVGLHATAEDVTRRFLAGEIVASR